MDKKLWITISSNNSKYISRFEYGSDPCYRAWSPYKYVSI